MGFFDRFRKKGAPPGGAPPPPEEPEPPEAPPDAVVVVREGMSTPSEEDMVAVVASRAPELVEVPRRGLSQPRWWRQDDWIAGGLRGVAEALVAELGIDPERTTWILTKDERGARVALVILRK